MAAERSTASQRRAHAVAAGMRIFADHGLTTTAMQRVADEIGVSQPYVFRLFGSKQAFFLACLDELEARVREVFRHASAGRPGDRMVAMRAGFRELIQDGMIPGFWLQACAAARRDETVAARCRSVMAAVMADAGQTTDASPDDLARALADGALVMMLQAIAVDLAGGMQTAIASLTPERTMS